MKLLLAIVFLFFINCDSIKQEDKVANDGTTKAYKLSKKEIESIDYIDYGLSDASKKAAEKWNTYSELENLILSIKTGDLSYFESDREIHLSFNRDLRANLPIGIISQPIAVRLRALETKFFKLRSAVSLSTTTKDELLISIEEFLVAASNLNLQINKKLEKEAQDISKINL